MKASQLLLVAPLWLVGCTLVFPAEAHQEHHLRKVCQRRPGTTRAIPPSRPCPIETVATLSNDAGASLEPDASVGDEAGVDAGRVDADGRGDGQDAGSSKDAGLSKDAGSPQDAGVELTCQGTPGQWAGCGGDGCSACTDRLRDYTRYFQNHPGCTANPSCGGVSVTCNDKCPAPTEADRAPVAMCNGTAGEWAGCRGHGCAVCTEQLQGYTRYVQNHPRCVVNPTCAGQFYTCNADCPAPTSADM